MRTIIVKLPSEANFASEMAGMREWLDKHRCAPSMFKYHLEQESVIIEVEFNEEEEAEIFKQYFDNRVERRLPGYSHRAQVRTLFDAASFRPLVKVPHPRLVR